jgi:hypothetical protein
MPEIRYARGETKPIIVSLVDGDGVALDITGQTEVRFALAERPGGPTVMARDSTVDDSSKIQVADNPAKVTIYPTTAESEALVAGKTYFADVWVTLSGCRIAAEQILRIKVAQGVALP